MGDISDELTAGMRVEVVQQIPHRGEAWTTKVAGTVVKVGQSKTGSWFAHGRDDKLWLDRLELRKDDGERVICNLDRFSHVEVLSRPEASSEA